MLSQNQACYLESVKSCYVATCSKQLCTKLAIMFPAITKSSLLFRIRKKLLCSYILKTTMHKTSGSVPAVTKSSLLFRIRKKLLCSYILKTTYAQN